MKFDFVPLFHSCCFFTSILSKNLWDQAFLNYSVRHCHLMANYCHDSSNRFWPGLHFDNLRVESFLLQSPQDVNVIRIFLYLKSWCVFVFSLCLFFSGGGALQAGGGLLQHEGGDPVQGFWSWLFRELRRCGHAGTSPAGKLCECNQQCKSKWRVHRRSQSNCASTVWAQLLQQWPFPCLHFWRNHW